MTVRQIRVVDNRSNPYDKVPFRVEGELTSVDDRTPLGAGPWTVLDYCATRTDAEARADGYRAALAAETARLAEFRRRYEAGEFDHEPATIDHCWECGLPITAGDGILDALGMAHRSCVGA